MSFVSHLVSHLRIAALGLGLALAAAAPAHAQITAFDSGRYDNTGFHDVDFKGTMTGVFDDTFVFRSFAAFDRATLLSNGPLTMAHLALFNPANGFGSDTGTETLQIRGLDTASVSAASLLDGSAGLAGYNALGSGTLFGTADVTSADNGRWVNVTLNQAFLDFANSTSDATIVLGAALSSLSGGDSGFNEFVFAGTSGAVAPRLNITPVPEASTMLYVFGLTAGVGLVAWRRRQSLSGV